MEYTVDAVEKQAISQLAHAQLLGELFTVELSSAPPVAGVMPIRALIKDEEVDATIHAAERLSLSVFDDAELTIPSTDVSLNTATEGTLLLGAGGPLIMAKTTEHGAFACSSTCSTPGVTRYLAASSSGFGGGFLSCRMVRTLVYP